MVVKSPAINWSETASAEKVRAQQICADTSKRDQIGRRFKAHDGAGGTLEMLLAFFRLRLPRPKSTLRAGFEIGQIDRCARGINSGAQLAAL
jgi:hypothetical protein